MWSTSKRDYCIRSVLLLTNCVACIAVVYIYITYTSDEDNRNGFSSETFIRAERFTDEQCPQVCDSKACIWHANKLLRNINASVNPCEDFHSFLCSRFILELDPDEALNIVLKATRDVKDKIRVILDNIEPEPGSASAKMKNVYDSCVDYGSSELQGIKDLKNLFNNIGILNWPDLPDNFSFNGMKQSELLGNFIVLVEATFIYLRRKPGNETHESYMEVTFSGREFGFFTSVNRESAISILKYFDLDAKHMDKIIKDHDLVRNAILKLYQDYGDCRNGTCPEYHFDCIRQTDDDWHELCETLRILLHFNDSTKSYPIAITKSNGIFFKNFFPLVHSFTNRTLANFVALSLIKKLQPELNFYFRLQKSKRRDISNFLKFFLYESYELDRKKFCANWIIKNMKLPLENEFFHHYLTNASTAEVSNIYKYHLSELTEVVNHQNWLNTTLKLTLTEQFKTNTFNIDILRRIFPNDTAVNKAYEEFLPTRRSFFNNAVRMKRFKMKRYKPFIELYHYNFSLEERALSRAEFYAEATSSWNDTVEIYFGMLVPPFYIPGDTTIINRVTLASVIGHELGHLVQVMMENEDRGMEKFVEVRQCLKDQYSRFKFLYLNENLKGAQYGHENVPDNVATSLIDKVIEKYSSEDIILPGLPYSTKQFLYMTSIQPWCGKSNLEFDLHFKNGDIHPPTEYKFRGMMQNSRGHAEAFNCPVGSFMNPGTKCTLLDTNI